MPKASCKVPCSSLIPSYVPRHIPAWVIPVNFDREISEREKRELELSEEALEHPEIFENADGTPDDVAWEQYCRSNGAGKIGLLGELKRESKR